MTIKAITTGLFLLGITTTALADGPVTVTYPSVQMKKGDSLKVDEAYCTVGLKKVVRVEDSKNPKDLKRI